MTEYTPATKLAHDDHRIVIRVNEDGHSAQVAQLYKVLADIRRHVDGFDSIFVVYDTQRVCAHCEHRWDWCVDDDGQPACCEEAVADYENQTGKKVS